MRIVKVVSPPPSASGRVAIQNLVIPGLTRNLYKFPSDIYGLRQHWPAGQVPASQAQETL